MPSPQKLPKYEQHRLALADVHVHVAELRGPARPMILLHGIGMDWRIWQAMSRRLHPYFTLYMVDLRGHGESDKPAHGYTLAHYAADIEDVIDTLELEDVTVVGSSLGAMVAASIEAPTELVSRRILVDPPLTGGPMRDPDQFETILTLKHGPPDQLASFLAASYSASGAFWLRTMADMWQNSADGVITDLLDRRGDAFAIDAAMMLDDAPTLIVRGDLERGSVTTEEQVQQALRLLPRGSAVHIAGAGHAIHADKPAEFTRILLEFCGIEAATSAH